MFLVDTNVISELATTKREAVRHVVDWLDRAGPRLFMSVISVAEIYAGIAKADREGAKTKARKLSEWWQPIEHLYADRLLPFDLNCARTAGEIIIAARAHRPGFEDIAIAATARVHELVVVTRNLRHFEPLGVQAVDPYIALPELG
jgi:toxin FitB